MGDREVDQQLVERAQRGDQKAFELLVVKYQRKLARLLSPVRLLLPALASELRWLPGLVRLGSGWLGLV